MNKSNTCYQCAGTIPGDIHQLEQEYAASHNRPYPPEPCCSIACMDSWWSDHGHQVLPVNELTLEQLNRELQEVGLELDGVGTALPN